ncbi:MAG TPA: AraC family transcriptional regulator [Methylomirabilota bacterium]
MTARVMTMTGRLRGDGPHGLERSCEPGAPGPTGWLRTRTLGDGVEVLQAWFAGHGYDRHRHDTYAIGLTDSGVQAFDYRGAARISTPGQVVVLHPDESHDGHAATADGFGYRIVYVAPARIAAAARAIRGRACALPFAPEPVTLSPALARAIDDAFGSSPEPLATDSLVLAFAEALLDADPSGPPGRSLDRLDARGIDRARQFLDAETDRVVTSSELEAVTGLTRYDLARQFRTGLGTSPYRYSLMRRLDRARGALAREASLADVALAAGFADQAHLSRMFKRAYGISPGRYRALIGYCVGGDATLGFVRSSSQAAKHRM